MEGYYDDQVSSYNLKANLRMGHSLHRSVYMRISRLYNGLRDYLPERPSAIKNDVVAVGDRGE